VSTFRTESQSNESQRNESQKNGARAVVVNRTHRVVREQALTMQEQKKKSRSLWVPVVIFSVLMVTICYAAWAMLDGYDLTPTGVPDASDQMMLLMLWSLPVTLLVLGMAWFKRKSSGNSEANGGEATR
jgi:hypothetical protein